MSGSGASGSGLEIPRSPDPASPGAGPRDSVAARLWTEARLLFTGGEYLDELRRAVDSARASVRIESYIFELDAYGEELLRALERKAAAGVRVRLLVDAIGSPGWTAARLDALARAGVRVRVFGRPRELFRAGLELILQGRFRRAFSVLRKVQLRNHRKLAIVDDELAFVGSANLGEAFAGWRETVVALRGPGIGRLRSSFVRSWGFSVREKIPIGSNRTPPPGIRNNFTRSERRAVNHRLVERVRETRGRVWITTAYFHPRPKLLFALFAALRRNVDVAIVVPRQSDVSFFPWLSRAFFVGLLDAGARIYEYEGAMMHAKTTVFDEEALVGSTNLNYRSFMHDLELDVLLDDPASVRALEARFRDDVARSVPVSRAMARGYSPGARLVSLALHPFKRWL